ncbi:uncharacterized protein LOC128963279 [Oppia nitens]|uniref:uncharacterized protein LOC128963279 n=1 Tax=Oppia nitens TaxID=1686743 RepID=UPI0023DA9D4D|nr:uncharacterized protein LOC128963279 [Oppia nitens]
MIEDISGDGELWHSPELRSLQTDINRESVVNKKCCHFQYNENNWVHYKDNKSYYLINKTVTKHEAEEICHTLTGKGRDVSIQLAIPESAGEQNFINSYLFFTKNLYKNVWIGRSTDTYKDRRGKLAKRRVLYANWIRGRPTRYLKPCIHIRSPSEHQVLGDYEKSNGKKFVGKWEDVSCFTQNLVLCERRQPWTPSQAYDMIKYMKTEINQLKQQKVTKLNYVPFGYIYIQLPDQMKPSDIWPQFNWLDISQAYEGLFLRIMGGQSGRFGEIQEPQAPHLVGVKSYGMHGLPNVEDIHEEAIHANNQWSDGHYNGFPVAFKVSSGEVRPKNIAVKIWRRV